MNHRVLIAFAGLLTGTLAAVLARHLAQPSRSVSTDLPATAVTSQVVWDAGGTGRGSWALGLTTYDRLPTPPDTGCPELYDWARDHGAVPLEETGHSIRVRVSGPAVNLKVLSIHVRFTGLSKGGARMEARCNPQTITPEENFQLRQQDGHLTIGTDGEDTLDFQAAFWKTDYTLGGGDTVSWSILVAKPAGFSDTSYVIDVTYLHQGHRRTATVDDEGRPFVLADLDYGMGYIPPSLLYVRTPTPRWDYTPAICTPPPCHNPETGGLSKKTSWVLTRK